MKLYTWRSYINKHLILTLPNLTECEVKDFVNQSGEDLVNAGYTYNPDKECWMDTNENVFDYTITEG